MVLYIRIKMGAYKNIPADVEKSSLQDEKKEI